MTPQNGLDCWEIEHQRRQEAEQLRLAFLQERRRLERSIFLVLALFVGLAGWMLYTVVMFAWRFIER